MTAREKLLFAALKKSLQLCVVRLKVCKARMELCNQSHPLHPKIMRHDLSILEIPNWIKETEEQIERLNKLDTDNEKEDKET